ncbi:MAG: phosphatidylserine decarboxylase, partial [Pseudomonadales bacterium]|nr:phosphatidylserine decarboxylase [Pseudomonadales bacterium]
DYCKSFQDVSFHTIYLSPRDYHRVHVPVGGSLHDCQYVPGRLFSVNETTTARVPDLFAANERLVGRFETPSGPMGLVMVGAMIVAAIKPAWQNAPFTPREIDGQTFDPPRVFEQAEEFASFLMGSTVILIFPDKVPWTVTPGQQVRLGQALVTDDGR